MITEQSTVDKVSAALVAAQGELEPATFDSTNPFLRNRYASLGSIIHQSRPILAKHGLAILQCPTTRDSNVCVATRIVHSSGQSLDCGTLELPIGEEKGKSRAQVAGSIVTYLRRYAWAAVLGMYADEDTDGNEPPKSKRQTAYSDDSEALGAFDNAQPSNHTSQAAKTPAKPVSAPPKATVDTNKTRLRALNLLKAAPGQPNRALFEAYLRSKLWITLEQHAEDWPAQQVPTTKEDFDALAEQVAQFEVQQREQNQGVAS